MNSSQFVDPSGSTFNETGLESYPFDVSNGLELEDPPDHVGALLKVFDFYVSLLIEMHDISCQDTRVSTN